MGKGSLNKKLSVFIKSDHVILNSFCIYNKNLYLAYQFYHFANKFENIDSKLRLTLELPVFNATPLLGRVEVAIFDLMT